MKETKKEKTECCCENVFKKDHHHDKCNCNHSSAIYGLGVVGALFYFLSHATSFSLVMIGIGKSLFWPAILMFKLLTYLNM